MHSKLDPSLPTSFNVGSNTVDFTPQQGDVVITNVRHFQSLKDTHDALDRVLTGMANGVTGDFMAMDVRQALYFLGVITGEISTDDLLENIFRKFCIGK